MPVDYSLILVVLTALTGIGWVIERFWLSKRRAESEAPRGVGRVVEVGGSLFPILLLVLLFRSFLFEPFKIPSGSMMPTLLIGDFIVVNKFAYGLRVPVINKRFISVGEPERGDVMVFRFPEDERINYIKRVIGLPGDRITYRNKILYINGEPMVQESNGAWIGEGQNRNPPGRRPVVKTEQLGDVSHEIVVYPDQPQRNARNWVVPEGHYFVLGDNRDQSLDSRAWGFVPVENLVGRATRIWMHWDCSRGCIDFSRIGDNIE
jgi:signal peptidase I